jgi:hypothetical protein
MEQKKLKEIEAKLNQLLKENKKAQTSEPLTTAARPRGVEVIRRRKGHSDLPIS